MRLSRYAPSNHHISPILPLLKYLSKLELVDFFQEKKNLSNSLFKIEKDLNQINLPDLQCNEIRRRQNG